MLLTAGCAAGKTVIFCEVVSWLRAHNRRALVLVDREQLVSQTAARLQEYIGEPVGIACRAVARHHGLHRPVVVASRQTLAPLMRNGNANYRVSLLILDEAHLATSNQYTELIERLRANHPDMRILGCTATPWRMFGGPIYGQKNSLWDRVDVRITTAELLDQGYLAPLTWKVRQSDFLAQLDRLEKSASGEIDEEGQARVVSQNTFIEGVYEAWVKECANRKTIVYALNIAHAEAISKLFEAKGVPAWVIHSKLTPWRVHYAISEFSRGSGVIVNVGILTIGSDIPSVTAIILARRTLSTALFFQIVGRGMRLYAGKSDCRIIDLAGNALIHGIDPDNPVIEIEESERKPQIKICPMCETAASMQAKTCPSCGFAYPIGPVPVGPVPVGEQKKIEDQGAVGELVDFRGFAAKRCEIYRYTYHLGAGRQIPTVEVTYRTEAGMIREWLCPQHPEGAFPQRKAKWRWFALGGKWPVPATVREWIERSGEMTREALVTIDESGRYPIVKKVEGDNGGVGGNSAVGGRGAV